MAEMEAREDAQNLEGSGDASQQQKYAAMLQRLAIKEDARLQKFAARRAESLAFVNPNESTDRFLQAFSESARELEQSLCSLQQAVSSEEGKSTAKSDLALSTIKISELEQFLAEHSYFLPAYEVRASQAAISALRQKVECINAELIPKKRFSFKSKASKDKKTTGVSSAKAPQPVQISDSGVGNVQDPQLHRIDVVTSEGKYRDAAEHAEGFIPQSDCMIRDLEGAVVVKDLKDQEDSEIILENLTNCKVYIQGICRAMYAHKLRSCKVYAGPTTGSALIEEVEECVMMLASQQIRIHHAKKTDMYLRVRSRPIVEHTHDIRFAPYAFSYPGIESDLLVANLGEETGLWEHVDDFRWLKAIPSPNWSVLPEEERVGTVEGSLQEA